MYFDPKMKIILIPIYAMLFTFSNNIRNSFCFFFYYVYVRNSKQGWFHQLFVPEMKISFTILENKFWSLVVAVLFNLIKVILRVKISKSRIGITT